jgi:hypothetical protein
MVRVFLVLFFPGAFAFAESRTITAPFTDIQVVSDSFNNDVPEGTFALRGHVIQLYGGQPAGGVLIANGAENPFVLTDSLGFYQMLFPISDTAIYCFKEGFRKLIFTGPFTNRHLIEVNFYLRDPNAIEICSKPVIYAYNAPGNVQLSLKAHGGFTFTYPQYKDNWTFKTNPCGGITELNTGKDYPYLFWEGEGRGLDFVIDSGHAADMIEGYLVKTDTCISFLENVLAQIGLNSREAIDFITFWGPQMIKKEYALVQFLDNENYARLVAEISVSPQPLSLLRTYMFFMPLDSDEIDFDFIVVEPDIAHFERKGFTVVEWGGTVLSESAIF